MIDNHIVSLFGQTQDHANEQPDQFMDYMVASAALNEILDIPDPSTAKEIVFKSGKKDIMMRNRFPRNEQDFEFVVAREREISNTSARYSAIAKYLKDQIDSLIEEIDSLALDLGLLDDRKSNREFFEKMDAARLMSAFLGKASEPEESHHPESSIEEEYNALFHDESCAEKITRFFHSMNYNDRKGMWCTEYNILKTSFFVMKQMDFIAHRNY